MSTETACVIEENGPDEHNNTSRKNSKVCIEKQVIYGFLVKNLDLDSNLNYMKKLIKKAS